MDPLAAAAARPWELRGPAAGEGAAAEPGPSGAGLPELHEPALLGGGRGFAGAGALVEDPLRAATRAREGRRWLRQTHGTLAKLLDAQEEYSQRVVAILDAAGNAQPHAAAAGWSPFKRAGPGLDPPGTAGAAWERACGETREVHHRLLDACKTVRVTLDQTGRWLAEAKAARGRIEYELKRATLEARGAAHELETSQVRLRRSAQRAEKAQLQTTRSRLSGTTFAPGGSGGGERAKGEQREAERREAERRRAGARREVAAAERAWERAQLCGRDLVLAKLEALERMELARTALGKGTLADFFDHQAAAALRLSRGAQACLQAVAEIDPAGDVQAFLRQHGGAPGAEVAGPPPAGAMGGHLLGGLRRTESLQSEASAASLDSFRTADSGLSAEDLLRPPSASASLFSTPGSSRLASPLASAGPSLDLAVLQLGEAAAATPGGAPASASAGRKSVSFADEVVGAAGNHNGDAAGHVPGGGGSGRGRASSRALYGHEAHSEGELSVAEGEHLEVLGGDEGGWTLCKTLGGAVGYVATAYIDQSAQLFRRW